MEKLTHYETNSIVKGILGKKMCQDKWARFWTFHSESLMIGGKPHTKVYLLKWIFKVCVLWLPRYFRYSIEAKTSQTHKDGRR